MAQKTSFEERLAGIHDQTELQELLKSVSNHPATKGKEDLTAKIRTRIDELCENADFPYGALAVTHENGYPVAVTVGYIVGRGENGFYDRLVTDSNGKEFRVNENDLNAVS